MENELAALSNELAGAVEQAGRAVVAVNARARFASSGVVWRPGVIVTAEHTIRRREEIGITLPDGRTTSATLAGRDAGTDLAVLKLAENGTPAATFGAPEKLKPGQVVLAIGRSPDSGVNATMGIMSAVSGAWRTWRGGQLDQYLRLDLTLYPASSGGAVVDTAGRVLGIATSALSRIAGLAVPVSTVDRVVDELLRAGHIARGYLGLGLHPVALPDGSTGLIVLSSESDGPAARAGVLIGDILTVLAGKPVGDTDDIQAALGGDAVGKPIAARIVRGGQVIELNITVGERPRREE
ncbi:MAG TPA: S1C family serine protease [Bryobacteraceae bacterium]|nr:S1C family serine protease [Bryobacteraceae bacterium]